MMTDIPQALKQLTAAVRADPLLSLAYAVAWLDPLWRANLNDFYDDGDSVHLALCILRGAFPDIYAEAVERLRIGTTGAALDHFISSAITARGIPLESISMLDYGIPLPAYGISLDEPDENLKSPALALVLRLFGITLDRESSHVIVPDGVYTVAQALSDSLIQQTDERLQQVGWGLAWVFSCSGNTLVDNDSLWELEPLSWEAEDVAFAIELIQEAERIMQAVDEGLHTLNTQPRLQQALSNNLQSLYRTIQTHKKGLPDGHHLRLEWPSPGASVE